MIRHLFNLLWNQRKHNIWIALELFFVFILLWYISDHFIMLGTNASKKNAFDISNTYKVELTVIPLSSPQYVPLKEGEALHNYLTITERIRQIDEIEDLSLSRMCMPYSDSYSSDGYGIDTTNLRSQHRYTITPSFFTVFRIQGLNGETPEQLSQLMDDQSTIISRKSAEGYFGSTPALGKELVYHDFGGVISRFKIKAVTIDSKRDEYSREEEALYRLFPKREMNEYNEEGLASLEICIRVKPGVTAEKLIHKLKKERLEQLQVGNFILSDVKSLESIRTSYLLIMGYTTQIRLSTAFMVFFLFNIFLGVIGTFWMRNEYRKPEIGLRIALGSSRKNILRMMIAESWLLLVFVAIPAIVICINIAYLELIGSSMMDITFWRVALGFVLTFFIMLLVVTFGTWYPAYLASQTAPADTLKAE